MFIYHYYSREVGVFIYHYYSREVGVVIYHYYSREVGVVILLLIKRPNADSNGHLQYH